MRRLVAIAGALALAATVCANGGGEARTVLVDFSHDEFASFFMKFFPTKVEIPQDGEVVFRQTWTGEPHTVTGGKLVDELGETMRPFLLEGEEIPDEPPPEVLEAMEAIGEAFAEEGLNQTLAQPCYLPSGDEVPTDGEPCPTQEQPVFDGTHNLYNSGVIPYEGPRGNEFSVRFSEDTEPGAYFFYCVVHGPLQASYVEVKPRGAELPSAQVVNREAREEINILGEPMVELFRQATDEGAVTVRSFAGHDVRIEGNFAGLYDRAIVDEGRGEVSINEFIPRRITARAGEPITWNIVGWHTISFGVPEYFPIIEFRDDGTVERNERLDPPAGGANELDLPEEELYDESRTEGLRFDGGTYDGEGFWSSGAIDADPYIEYSMTITRPGTYRYACLVHPPMVGTVVVTE